MPAAECHRFLHTNYNCTDLERLEAWYASVFELKPVMRSEGGGSKGEAFGIFQLTSSRVSFLYDHRGGRHATSVELVQWVEPPTAGEPYPNPWDHGLQSVGFLVPDIDVAAERAVGDGQVVR